MNKLKIKFVSWEKEEEALFDY